MPTKASPPSKNNTDYLENFQKDVKRPKKAIDSKIKTIFKALALGSIFGGGAGVALTAAIGAAIVLTPGAVIGIAALTIPAMILATSLIAGAILFKKRKKLEGIQNLINEFQNQSHSEISFPDNAKIPVEFANPLNPRKIMHNPIRLPSGKGANPEVYDFSTFKEALNEYGIFRCPRSGVKIQLSQCQLDLDLRQQIENWADQQNQQVNAIASFKTNLLKMHSDEIKAPMGEDIPKEFMNTNGFLNNPFVFTKENEKGNRAEIIVNLKDLILQTDNYGIIHQTIDGEEVELSIKDFKPHKDLKDKILAWSIQANKDIEAKRQEIANLIASLENKAKEIPNFPKNMVYPSKFYDGATGKLMSNPYRLIVNTNKRKVYLNTCDLSYLLKHCNKKTGEGKLYLKGQWHFFNIADCKSNEQLHAEIHACMAEIERKQKSTEELIASLTEISKNVIDFPQSLNKKIPYKFQNKETGKLMNNPYKHKYYPLNYDLSTLLKHCDKNGIIKDLPNTLNSIAFKLTNFEPDPNLRKEILDWIEALKIKKEIKTLKNKLLEEASAKLVLKNTNIPHLYLDSITNQLMSNPFDLIDPQTGNLVDTFDLSTLIERCYKDGSIHVNGRTFTLKDIKKNDQLHQQIHEYVKNLQELEKTTKLLKMQMSKNRQVNIDIPKEIPANLIPSRFKDICGEVMHNPYKVKKGNQYYWFDYSTIFQCAMDTCGIITIDERKFNLHDFEKDTDMRTQLSEWVKGKEPHLEKAKLARQKWQNQLSNKKISSYAYTNAPSHFKGPNSKILSHPVIPTKYSENNQPVVKPNLKLELSDVLKSADAFGIFKVEVNGIEEIFNIINLREDTQLIEEIHTWITAENVKRSRIKEELQKNLKPIALNAEIKSLVPNHLFDFKGAILSTPYKTPGGFTYDLSTLLHLTNSEGNFYCSKEKKTYSLSDCNLDEELQAKVHNWIYLLSHRQEITAELEKIVEKLEPLLEEEKESVPLEYKDAVSLEMMIDPYQTKGYVVDERHISGQSYNLSTLESLPGALFGSFKCPLTKQPYLLRDCKPNVELQMEILTWAKAKLAQLELQKQARIDQALKIDEEKKQALLAQLNQLDGGSEAPEEFLDPFTFELMQDPYTTPGYYIDQRHIPGKTYDRQTIIDCSKDGIFQDEQGQKYNVANCQPNKELKKQIDEWKQGK